MARDISRRGVLGGGVVAIASGAVPVVNLTTLVQKDSPAPDGISKTFSESTKKIYAAQLEQGRSNSLERLKTKLAEGSEPCFMIHAQAATNRGSGVKK